MSTKNILITGASRGIGFATTKILATKGHHIFALSRNIAPLEKLKYENPAFSITPIAMDLGEGDFTSLKSVLANTNLDAVINNAGLLINKPFIELSKSELEQMYQVNVISIWGLIQAVYSNLKSAKGSITNISSVGGVNGTSKFPGLSGYSSSKGALITLTECMAEEFKEDHINVNALALGAVQTEMLAEAFPGYEANVSPEQMASYIANFVVNDSYLFNGCCLNISNSTP